jgi:hypothetical protein
MKNVIRIANPAAVMSGVLDLFLAQPFGSRSLLQRILSMTLSDGIKAFQKSIDSLYAKIADPVLCDKIKCFTNADEEVKNILREEATREDVDIVVAILRSELFTPELTPEQIGKVFNAYVAWTHAVENVCPQILEYQHLLILLGRCRDEAGCTTLFTPQATSQTVDSTTRQSYDDGYH